MTKNYPGEQWKQIDFGTEHINQFRMEISNFGRLRSFNKISNGNIINGSMINGYRIIRLKLFRPRDKKMQKELEGMREVVATLLKQYRGQTDKPEKDLLKSRLLSARKSLAKKTRIDEKNRTIYYQSLIHRLVATYFLKKPLAAQTIVAHLDYDKLNNRTYNLKWMTLAENSAHQQNSPHVIAEKIERTNNRRANSRTKLSVTKVMLLKKLLNENKPMKALVKQFRVTDTQIIRIRKGINWAEIKAAP